MEVGSGGGVIFSIIKLHAQIGKLSQEIKNKIETKKRMKPWRAYEPWEACSLDPGK